VFVLQLKLALNEKTKFARSQYNTFGLMYGLPKDGGTCPGATKGCGGCLSHKGKSQKTHLCYMSKLTYCYPKMHKILVQNTKLLKGKSQTQLETILTRTVESFIKRTMNMRNYKPEMLAYRLHYSGDFFSRSYAQAWKNVILKFPQVKFWGYTRTFEILDYFNSIPNATLFISADPVNWPEAKKLAKKYAKSTSIGLSWMGEAPPQEYNWTVCPGVAGTLKHKNGIGSCGVCGMCLPKDRKLKNIQFPLH